MLAAFVSAKTLILVREFPLLLATQSLALVAVAILLAGRPPLDLRQILAEGRS
ncbi:hypothetical protein D3C83_215690 [compost metagenome]